MNIVMLAAAAALLASPALAQQAAPAPLQVDIPELPTAVADPTCGGKVGLAQQAQVVGRGAAGNAAADDYDAGLGG